MIYSSISFSQKYNNSASYVIESSCNYLFCLFFLNQQKDFLIISNAND